jgi:hypothetical protein
MKNSTDKIYACPLCGHYFASLGTDGCFHSPQGLLGMITPVLMEVDEALSRCYEDMEELQTKMANASDNLEKLKEIKRDY